MFFLLFILKMLFFHFRQRNLSKRQHILFWNRWAKEQDLCPKFMFVSQTIFGSQDPLLWHWSLPFLRYVRVWRCWISYCRIFFQRKRVLWRLQRGLHSDLTPLSTKGLWQAFNWIQLRIVQIWGQKWKSWKAS